MGKSKLGGLARLPKEQKCQFLIGPVSSWFMPNTTDIWTQHTLKNETQSSDKPKEIQIDVRIESDQCIREENAILSFFVYGSIGCFCYGEINHQNIRSKLNSEPCDSSSTPLGSGSNQISAIVRRLIDIKDDNSRVSCIKFLKQSPYPIVVALTESGSLVIHDCMRNENLIQLKKSGILTKFLGLANQELNFNNEQNTKRAKFGVTEQINSCAWPNPKNIFLGISMIKEKNCFLLWLKLKDISFVGTNESSIKNDTLVESSQKIDLDLQHYANPICTIESKMLNDSVCILAIAMDDGLITVLALDIETGQVKRNIKLARHNDQISSLSLCLDNQKKFPLGLLASVSRDGLMLIWDLENEFYFADYQAIVESGGNTRGANTRINWFATSFINSPNHKQVHVAISNPDSGITLFELPENARSKIRLKESKNSSSSGKQPKGGEPMTLKHNALIFNIQYDQITSTIITSSLDGNHLLWTAQKSANVNNQQTTPSEAKPRFLIPAMLNNSRTHMMRSSPIREDLVCLSLGKAGVKFYKISSNIRDCKFDMSPSCSLIARKITKAAVSPTSVAWHPGHEYRLAIGTLEGKVFRADITPRKAALIEAEHRSLLKSIKPVERSMNVDDIFGVDYSPLERKEEQYNIGSAHCDKKQPQTDAIYSICWGPNPVCPQDVSKFAIYAVGSISHRLFIYYASKETSDKITNYLDEFQDVSLPEAREQASEVAWKSSMDLMALGTTDGKILIVSHLEESHEDRSNHRLFKRIAVIEGTFGCNFIQCLAWHPTIDQDDPHYHYLAASSNQSPAFVFNLKESMLIANVKAQLKLDKPIERVLGEIDESKHQMDSMAGLTVLSSYVNKLEAHQKDITDIAWNPHEPDQIATSSFDRMCYVWSINNSFLEAKMLSKFAARDRLFTLEWSLVDEDLIFTSGHDSTIWAWRPSENSIKTDE